MRLLILSYRALPETGKVLADEARERGAEAEALELEALMSQSKRAVSRCSRFVRSAKELLSSVYKSYDPLDYQFIAALARYIGSSEVDAVICTDAYSVKVASLMKQAGLASLCYAVVSDYEAASLSAPAILDGYFIAQEEIKYYMLRRGIKKDRLYNYGLPLPKGFRRSLGKRAARNYLFIPQDKRVYLLLAGDMSYQTVMNLCVEMLEHEDESFLLYVILPRDSELMEKLSEKLRKEPGIHVIALNKRLNIYMEGADVVLTRPLAFESYEAAAVGAPLVHVMTAKPDENKLAEFFAGNDMSLKAACAHDAISQARRLADEKAVAYRMARKQEQFAQRDAADRILETILQNR